ncbi:MAG: hypothetical protein V3V30_03640, partial [Parvularculaceae bacterium]
ELVRVARSKDPRAVPRLRRYALPRRSWSLSRLCREASWREVNRGIKFNNLNLWELFLTLLTGGLIWRLLADSYGEC